MSESLIKNQTKKAKRWDSLICNYLPSIDLKADCPNEPIICGTCEPVGCKEELRQFKKAFRDIAAGKAYSEVQEGDRRVRFYFSQAHIAILKECIQQLEEECGDGPQNNTVCDPCGNTSFIRRRPAAISFKRRWA